MVTILVVLIYAFMAIIIGYLIRESLKIKPHISNKWKEIDTFAKKCLLSGIILIVFIPIVKAHPTADTIFGKMICLLFENIGIAVFAFGVIESLKVISDHQNDRNND